MSYTEPQTVIRFGPGLTPMVKKLLIITCSVFGLQFASFLATGTWDSRLIQFGALTPREALPGFQVWRLATYMFLHGPDPFHIGFNMLGLFFFGPMVERELGRSRHFLFFYLLCGMTGGLCQAAAGLALGEAYPIIGASAAVIGSIAAAAVLFPDSRVIFIIFPMKLKHMAILFVGIDLFYSLVDLRTGTSGVARIAHLAGAAVGFLYARNLDRINAWHARRRARAARAPREKTARNAAELDRLLAKVHDQGLGSLTKKERVFLMEQSGKEE